MLVTALRELLQEDRGFSGIQGGKTTSFCNNMGLSEGCGRQRWAVPEWQLLIPRGNEQIMGRSGKCCLLFHVFY